MKAITENNCRSQEDGTKAPTNSDSMICLEMYGSFARTGILSIPIPSRRIRTMTVVHSWCFVVAVGLTLRMPFESLFGAETCVLSDTIIWVFGFAGQPSEFALLTIFQSRIAEVNKPRVEAGKSCPPFFCGDRNI